MIGYKTRAGGKVPADFAWATNPKQWQANTPETLARSYQSSACCLPLPPLPRSPEGAQEGVARRLRALSGTGSAASAPELLQQLAQLRVLQALALAARRCLAQEGIEGRRAAVELARPLHCLQQHPLGSR